MASAADEEILAPIAYAITFLVTIMLTKAAIAYGIQSKRKYFSNRVSKIVGYLWHSNDWLFGLLCNASIWASTRDRNSLNN